MLSAILAVNAMWLSPAPAPPRFVESAEALGLAAETVAGPVARVAFADVDDDEWPDLLVDRHRVFLNRPCGESSFGRRFVELPRARTGLPEPHSGTVLILVDLDGDATLDAVSAEHCDVGNPEWEDHRRRSRWQRGRGDGTFEPPRALPLAPRTTISVAAGDVDGDGRADLWFGNGYVRYGASHEAWPNDLILNRRGEDGLPAWQRVTMPEDSVGFDEERDLAGRPAYGVMILALSGMSAPGLLELAYGRRWNRFWARELDGWRDMAPELGLDGDAVRHGRYPEWLAERARSDPRFARTDERPFRSNGNTFDAAVGDVDGDGRFDLLLTEITHAWAGESSDRTRILFDLGEARESGPRFAPRSGHSLDRIPGASTVGASPEGSPADPKRWNQGDLFGALADLDNDGRLDVIVSSGEYPDDERLRVWRNTGSGLEEVTARWGIDHDGSQQFSLADIDGDGDLDLAVGQSFNRYGPTEIAGRRPRLAIYMNEATEGRRGLVLRLSTALAGLEGGQREGRSALGAIVELEHPDGSRRLAQHVGPGGHAGKQHDAIVHFGLGHGAGEPTIRIKRPGLPPESLRQPAR
jgi:hypothetical protein